MAMGNGGAEQANTVPRNSLPSLWIFLKQQLEQLRLPA